MTHRMSRGTATPQNSQGSVPRTIITWLIALCVWLKKKLLHILNSVSFLEIDYSRLLSRKEEY